MRLNDTDLLVLNQFSILSNNSLTFLYKDRCYNITSLDSYWYRRGALIIDSASFKITDNTNLNLYLRKEYFDLITGIHFFLTTNTNSISSFLDNDTNKLANLVYAKKAGLTVPETIVTTMKSVLLPFFHQCSGKIITKPIYHIGYYEDALSFYGALTWAVTEEDIDELPETFGVSLFQKNIEKAFELRIFFLHGKIFSTAIFSQNDKMTQTDFRNYNRETPNRVVAFELSGEIKNKLGVFMQIVNMNSGSIDMIYDTNGNYVFLELNPVGQFGMTSEPCNYNIDRLIAEKICNYEGIYPG